MLTQVIRGYNTDDEELKFEHSLASCIKEPPWWCDSVEISSLAASQLVGEYLDYNLKYFIEVDRT